MSEPAPRPGTLVTRKDGDSMSTDTDTVTSTEAGAGACDASPARTDRPGGTATRARIGGNWGLALLAGLTVLLGALAVLAPVEADDPVVTWPQAGQAPTSTVLPLSPYRPLSLAATVPCATVRAIDRTGGTVLSTQSVGDQGLRISAKDGRATFSVSGHRLLTEPVRQGDCVYRVVADSAGVQVLVDGVPLGEQRGLLPPQIAEISTQAEGLPEAGGLAVELHTDARYQSSPSTLKLVLLIAHALSLVTLLVLAWRRWRGGPSMRVLTWPKWSWADAAVLVVSGIWVFIGPMQMDDAWYLLMARNAAETGYVGNYIYMFNTTESPFVLSQYALQAWGELGGWSLWWMRLVPVFCGVLTWFLLRVTLATMLGRAARLRVVPWALLVAHLLWFLPYGTSFRPEPVILLCAAATLLFAEAARLRRSIGALAMAVLVATLAITASPSGVVAVAPLVLALPWLTTWMRRQAWSARIAAGLLALAAMTVAVPVSFTDATLGDFLDATGVHTWYYLAHPWYEEILHYNTLLYTAGWGRRVPVLLTLALLLVFAVAHGRRGGNDPVRRLVLTSGITSAIALGLIALSPTKWVTHFHAVAAAPTVLIAAALVRSPLPRRSGPVIKASAILIVIGAVSLSFAGDNLWHPFTDAGQRFGNHLDTDPVTNHLEPHFGPLYLSNPLLWIGVALVAWAWARWRRRRGKLVRLEGERSVFVVASVGAVVLLLALFTYAPISQAPGWTVASAGVRALSGDGCGLATDVKVLLPASQRLAPATGPAKLEGDFLTGRPDTLRVDPWADQTMIWHDARPDGTTTATGSLTTGWYPLPPDGGTHVSVPFAGALGGQRLRAEFGAGDPAAPRVVRTVELEPDIREPLEVWQQLPVELPDRRPSAVRVSVSDVVTGANSWVAVAEPRLTELRSVDELTRGNTVFADQISAPLWPCVRQARIINGISETPVVWLNADELIFRGILTNPFYLEWGGAWVQLSRASARIKLHSELRPEGPPRKPWGQVFTIGYPYPVGRFDLRVDKVDRSGLAQLPTLANNDYPDIERNAGIQPDTPPKPAPKPAG